MFDKNKISNNSVVNMNTYKPYNMLTINYDNFITRLILQL